MASDSLVGKVGGASGAIMGMVAALSLGGPLGAAVAGVTVLTTAIGYFRREVAAGQAGRPGDGRQDLGAPQGDHRSEERGTIDAFVTQNAAEQTLEFFTDFRDQVNSAEEEANGFEDSVKKAFSIALTGDLKGDGCRHRPARRRQGIRVEPCERHRRRGRGRDERSGPQAARRERRATRARSRSELTPAGRAAAERAVADASAILRKGVEAGAIDARYLFDRIFVEQTGDMYQVMRQGLSGIDQEMLKALGRSLANAAGGT